MEYVVSSSSSPSPSSSWGLFANNIGGGTVSSPSGFEPSCAASSSVLSSSDLTPSLESFDVAPKPKPTGLPMLPKEAGFPKAANPLSDPELWGAIAGGVAKNSEVAVPPVVAVLDAPLSLESEEAPNVKGEEEPLSPNGDGAKEGPDAFVASAFVGLENEKGSLLSEPEVPEKGVELGGNTKPLDLGAEDDGGGKMPGAGAEVDEGGFGADSPAGAGAAAGFPKAEENIVGGATFCFVASEVSNSVFSTSRCFLYVSKCVSDQSASGSSA